MYARLPAGEELPPELDAMPPTAATRTVTNAKGRTIHLRDGDERADALLDSPGTLTQTTMAIWQGLLAERPWDLVVDVGANYGEMLLGVDLPPGAEVVAFEPEPRIRECLELSLRDAGLPVEVRPQAVSSEPGDVTFLVDDRWSGTSRLAAAEGPEADLRAVTVEATSLDVALLASEARTACIKIDVEGAEDLVLAGARGLVTRLDEVALLVEILHRQPEQLVAWARDWRMYVGDRRTAHLVRVPPGSAADIQVLLAQPWVYPQDAVLRAATGAA